MWWLILWVNSTLWLVTYIRNQRHEHYDETYTRVYDSLASEDNYKTLYGITLKKQIENAGTLTFLCYNRYPICMCFIVIWTCIIYPSLDLWLWWTRASQKDSANTWTIFFVSNLWVTYTMYWTKKYYCIFQSWCTKNQCIWLFIF